VSWYVDEKNASCAHKRPYARLFGSVPPGAKDGIMRGLVVVLLLLIGFASGTTFAGCNNTRAAVLECVEQLLDLDHNGQITPVEVAVALRTTFTFVPDWLTWQMVMRCDLNEDGVLSMEDWNINPTNITCLPTPNCINIACSVCVQNGFSQTKRGITPEQQQHPHPSVPGAESPLSPTPHNVHRDVSSRRPEEVIALVREVMAEMKQDKASPCSFYFVHHIRPLS
jgi:hypothetical protein